MKPEDALRLDNWFPEESEVSVRGGFVQHTEDEDVTGNVESLMAWRGPSSQKLFAAVNGKVVNVSTPGSATDDLTSQAEDRWQHTNFPTPAGTFLYIVNGTDSPRYYNGSSWTDPTITGTGLTDTNLIHVNVFKNRLFFVEKNTLSAWYFPVETISGAITEYDLGSFCAMGGYLMAMATWTIDGGTGIDDYAVFITSQGEYLIFRGTDPSDADNWAHIGTFRLGAPIGRRCTMKLGGDLIVITLDGFEMLSASLVSSRTSNRAKLSDKIGGAVKASIRAKRGNFGWQPIFYPKGNMAVFNIPLQETTTSHQYVMNTTTRAWCRFVGQNAFCWEIYNDDLYFGGADNVFQADSGLSDNGDDIEADAKTAFTYFNRRGQLKRFSMTRPILTVDGSLYVAMTVNVDFEDDQPTAVPSFTPDEGEEWDESEWDVASWGTGSQINKAWQSVTGLGYAAAMRMRVVAQNGSISWQSLDWIWEPAGTI